jgi:prefoldin subunit 5
MASAVHQINILKAELDLSTKLSNLEKRTAKLESEFSDMMQSARELSNAMKRYVDKTETETRVR